MGRKQEKKSDYRTPTPNFSANHSEIIKKTSELAAAHRRDKNRKRPQFLHEL